MENIFSNSEQYISLAVQYGSQYGLKLILALLVFFIGKRVARFITNMVVKLMKKNDIDVELISFMDSLIYWLLFALVCIAALGQIGVQTASFIALIGAAGLAVGLALQGSLSNFAAGVLIIILRPFRVGEFVEVAGEAGSIQSIKIFTTELRTGDNKCVIIPNARVLESNIVNYSSTGKRRIDLVFGIGYNDDIDQARNVFLSIIEDEQRILKDPEPVIAVAELADSSVNFIVRPWVKTEDYWAVSHAVTEQVKKRFDAEKISIPFPQQDVNLIKADA